VPGALGCQERGEEKSPASSSQTNGSFGSTSICSNLVKIIYRQKHRPGYRKHFGVDWACAFSELVTLGVRIDSGYKSRVLQSVQNRIDARRRRRINSIEANEPLLEQDETHAYIAGYTPAGFAYCVTREEREQLDQNDSIDSHANPESTYDDDPDDIPF